MRLEPFAPVFACFSLYCVFETWPYGQVFLASLSGDAGRQIVSNLGLPNAWGGLRAPLLVVEDRHSVDLSVAMVPFPNRRSSAIRRKAGHPSSCILRRVRDGGRKAGRPWTWRALGTGYTLTGAEAVFV